MAVVPAPVRDTLVRLGSSTRVVENQVRFLGDMMVFTGRALRGVPLTLRRYREEVMRQIGQLTLGTGLVLTFTGTLLVVISEALFVGIEVGVEGVQRRTVGGRQVRQVARELPQQVVARASLPRAGEVVRRNEAVHRGAQHSRLAFGE